MNVDDCLVDTSLRKMMRRVDHQATPAARLRHDIADRFERRTPLAAHDQERNARLPNQFELARQCLLVRQLQLRDRVAHALHLFGVRLAAEFGEEC